MKFKSLLLLSVLLTTQLLAEEALPTEEDIYAGVLKSQGGSAALSKIKSMRIQGEIQTEKETIPFTLIRKKPNRVRLALNYPRGTYVMAYNGEVVWSHNEGTSHKDVQLVTGENANNFKLNAPFFGYLIEPERYQTKIKLIEWSMWDDKRFLKVSVTTMDRDSVTYYIDPETYHIMRMIFQETKDGKALDLDSRFSDFRPVGVLTEPFHTEVLTNGEFESTQILKTFELNPGVLDASFAPPAGSLTQAPMTDKKQEETPRP